MESEETTAKPLVLLVEDNASNLSILRGILNKLDCELMDAANGRDALKIINKKDFAIILLDVNLPDMDGFKIAETLSEDSRKRETPLIFISATFTDDMSRLKGYKLGAVDYITKPVDPFVLRSKVKVFLDLYNSQLRQKELRKLLHKRNKQMEQEIIERQRAEERARHQASHDPLTDLPNRILFMDRLDTAIARANREKGQLGLIYIDLDKFKPVNDTHGHQAGDELLRQIAERLTEHLREADTVARLGGDEFAVVLEKIHGREDAIAVMDKISASLEVPFKLQPAGFDDSFTVLIGGSLGLAIYPDDADEEEALLRYADEQMYKTKKSHKKK